MLYVSVFVVLQLQSLDLYHIKSFLKVICFYCKSCFNDYMELTKQMSLLLCNDTCYSCHELSDMVVCSAEFHCLLCAQLGKVLRSFPSSLPLGFMMEAWCKRRTNDKNQLIFLHKVVNQLLLIRQLASNYKQIITIGFYMVQQLGQI